MSIWKVTITEEDTGHYTEYYGVAKKATVAGEKALILAQKAAKNDKNFDDELYVSGIARVAIKAF